MEENNTTTPAQKKGMSAGIIVVVLIAILAVAGFVYASNNQTQEVAREEQTPSGTTAVETTSAPTIEAMTAESAYKDGTYTATGEYQSPGGAETIDVELTLADGVITTSNVVSKAQRPISKQKQTDFIGGYKALVDGKNIDEVNLDVVSGSSLTPRGFNDAVEKIKQQAQA